MNIPLRNPKKTMSFSTLLSIKNQEIDNVDFGFTTRYPLAPTTFAERLANNKKPDGMLRDKWLHFAYHNTISKILPIFCPGAKRTDTLFGSSVSLGVTRFSVVRKRSDTLVGALTLFAYPLALRQDKKPISTSDSSSCKSCESCKSKQDYHDSQDSQD